MTISKPGLSQAFDSSGKGRLMDPVWTSRIQLDQMQPGASLSIVTFLKYSSDLKSTGTQLKPTADLLTVLHMLSSHMLAE